MKVIQNNKFKYCIAVCLFVLASAWASAQTLTITGTVSDVQGEPLPGVNIRVQGTTTGTTTDVSGKYSIAAPGEQSVLQFSFIGFTQQDVVVGSQRTVNITLEEDALELDEVVVVGYGSLPKRSVTTSISSVNAERIQGMPVGTLGEALYGQMTGLYMVQNDGQPGSAPSMRIRGTGSLMTSGNNAVASEPLFVIDGYPTNDAQIFANLSAESIESIQVLKDAASAAIYGSRAGNGVILVTTKKGAKGGYPVISFNATAGIQQPQRYIDVLGPAEFAEFIKEAREYKDMKVLPIYDDPDKWVETDWQREYFRTAPMQRYELSARGASDKVNYSMSLNYSDQQGIVHNSFFKRIGARFQVDSELSKYVSVGASVAPTWTVQRRQTTTGGNTSNTDGTVADAVTMAPIFPAYMPNGDYFQILQHANNANHAFGESGLNAELTNPLSKIMETNNDYTNFRTLSQGFINVRPVKGLVLKSEFNLSTRASKREMYRTSAHPYTDRGATTNKSTPNMSSIGASRQSWFDYGWHWSNSATYTHVFDKVHSLTALLAYDVTYESEYNVEQTTRTDASFPNAFGNDFIQNVEGAYLWNGSSDNTEYVSDAIVGRVNYDYMGKYLLSASVRQDRSSKFGPDQRAGIFWSVSGGWNMAEEAFAKDIEWLSVAKLRASYGVSGNDRIGGNYTWTGGISTLNYAYGSGSAVNTVMGYYPSGWVNRRLSWEENTQFDAGIDLGLFKRLSVSIDWYTRLSDAVMSVSVPNLNGKSASVVMNAGEVRNRGVEIQLNSPILDREFKWTAGFNISFNRNKLMSLATGMDYYGTNAEGMVRNYVGRALGDMYLYKGVGIFKSENEVKTLPRYRDTGDVGDIRFEDNSGPNGTPDGVVNYYDMTYRGNNMPKFNYGFVSRMSYKNFDLSIVLDGQYGGLIYWSCAAYALNRHMENVTAVYARDRAHVSIIKDADGKIIGKELISEGDGKSSAATGNTTIALSNADRYLFKSDYLKIRNVGLGYTLPSSVTDKIGLRSLRVNVNAQNLWSFDEYPSYSVESGGMGGTSGGSGGGEYPVPRIITFGVNLSF
jgi:TonB-linked SusC/RagA family outer membrane protein